jgi:hypothetical protein
MEWMIADPGLDDVPNWQNGSRTDQAPVVNNQKATEQVQIRFSVLHSSEGLIKFNDAKLAPNLTCLHKIAG